MDQTGQFISGNQDHIFLNADSTKIDTHGKQAGEIWIHHHNQIRYRPFFINKYNSKALVGASMPMKLNRS